MLNHLLDVLEEEIRCRVGHQIGHSVEHRRVREAGSFKGIIDRMQCRQVIERCATGDGYLGRFRVDLGRLMAGVVALKLRFLAGVGRKRNGAADLQNHLGNSFAQPGNLVAIFLQVLGDVARLWIAHINVQERGAGVIAIHRGLSLLFPCEGKFLFRRAIPR